MYHFVHRCYWTTSDPLEEDPGHIFCLFAVTGLFPLSVQLSQQPNFGENTIWYDWSMGLGARPQIRSPLISLLSLISPVVVTNYLYPTVSSHCHPIRRSNLRWMALMIKPRFLHHPTNQVELLGKTSNRIASVTILIKTKLWRLPLL